MKLLVFGLGYSAGFFARHGAGEFSAIAGTTRTGKTVLPGVEPLAFDGLRSSPEVMARIAQAGALLVGIAPDADGDPVLRHFGAAVAAADKLSRIVYLSTIGVYGDHGGAWIDEETAPAPSSPRTVARVEAEKGWLAMGELGKSVHVLRLAGIYGPGRNALENLKAGTARRIDKPGQVFNRIHVADISRAIAAAFARTGCAVWNVADTEPAPPQEVIAYAAGLLGMEPPPLLPFGKAEMTPMAKSFYSDNKRVRNKRLLDALGGEMAYPTYREGLAALAG